jgi:segregation and condensation protein A
VDQQAIVEGEDEEVEDPRWELIRQLVEYKKFKDAAAQLQVLEARQENVFPRVPGKIEFENQTTTAKPEVGIFDLLSAVNHILKRFTDKEDSTRQIYEDKWTVSEKIALIQRLIAEQTAVKFSTLFDLAANRAEVICTFLALLELVRLKQLACTQPEPFAEIQITRPQEPAATGLEAPNPTALLEPETLAGTPSASAVEELPSAVPPPASPSAGPAENTPLEPSSPPTPETPPAE